MPIIDVQQVSKEYRPRGAGTLLAAGRLSNLFHKQHREPVVALRDISFTVESGESLGLIGANGSGKSTLLKLLAGVTVPTRGHVSVQGRVASLLELGAGFHPLLTGRENIYLNARILGMDYSEVNAVFDSIVEFSGIGKFIDQAVNTYSSGMYVRLGFAVAVHANPDIFLVDEVLSVGDEEFQRRCRTRIGELREQGKTIVFVSHDLGIVNTLCDRVILLSQGKMVSRGTPRETIEFYLRQIGRDSGIHTFAGGTSEAIFCNGRLSLFHNQHEITSPHGLVVGMESMGQHHESTVADWQVDVAGPDHCHALGRMSRLPVTLDFAMRFEGDRLVWDVAMECAHEVKIDRINANLYWPPSFTHWFYGDSSGVFPNILPGDLSWTAVVWPDPNTRETALLPRENVNVSPVMARLHPKKDYFGLLWSNADYVMGARALQSFANVPEYEAVFAPGRHELFTLEIDLGKTREDILAWQAALEAERTLKTGLLTGRFESGRFRFAFDGEPITSFLHFYSSMFIGNFWDDSTRMQWSAPVREGETLTLVGESRRFPYRQEWRLEAVPEGIAIRVMLEAREAFDANEYHASIVLRSDYDHWRTEFEAGEYPPFEAGQKDWRHANRIYAAGQWAEATGPNLPKVILRNTADELAFRMTAINTGFHESARVLQALRTPDAGMLHFEPGTHLYFEGLISAVRESQPE